MTAAANPFAQLLGHALPDLPASSTVAVRRVIEGRAQAQALPCADDQPVQPLDQAQQALALRDEKRAKARAYKRAWKAAHPEQVAKQQLVYREKNRDRLCAYHRERYHQRKAQTTPNP